MRTYIFLLLFVSAFCFCSVGLAETVPADNTLLPDVSDVTQFSGDDAKDTIPKLAVTKVKISIDFLGILKDLSKALLKQLSTAYGFTIACFAVLLFYDKIRETSSTKKLKKRPEKDIDDKIWDDIDKDLRRWGRSRGYSVNYIKRRGDLLADYYDDRYGTSSRRIRDDWDFDF